MGRAAGVDAPAALSLLPATATTPSPSPAPAAPGPSGKVTRRGRGGSRLRRFRRFCAGSTPPSTWAGNVRAQTVGFGVAQGLVRGFYAFSFYLAVTRLPDLVNHPTPASSLLLWPVAWLGWTRHAAAGVYAIVGLLLAGTGLAALFAEHRAARLLAAAGWLEYVALENSSVKIGHSLHLVVLLSAVLVALPRGWDLPAAALGRLGRQRALLVFWACQAATLLTYSLSGLGKIGGSIFQFALGQTHAFSPNALAYHVADRLLQTASLSVLGGWLIRFPWAGWPAMLGTVYLQCGAFAIAFRPGLQRWWAAGLIGFHLASFFTMTINFPQNCFLLALLFFRSPFAPGGSTPTIPPFLGQLPLFGPLLRWRWPGTFPVRRAGLG